MTDGRQEGGQHARGDVSLEVLEREQRPPRHFHRAHPKPAVSAVGLEHDASRPGDALGQIEIGNDPRRQRGQRPDCRGVLTSGHLGGREWPGRGDCPPPRTLVGSEGLERLVDAKECRNRGQPVARRT